MNSNAYAASVGPVLVVVIDERVPPFILLLLLDSHTTKACEASVGSVLVVDVTHFNSHGSFSSSCPQDPITNANGSRIFTPCLRFLIEYLSLPFGRNCRWFRGHGRKCDFGSDFLWLSRLWLLVSFKECCRITCPEQHRT
jgi:hypothetical protein